jgi:hypothetical protein
MMWACSRLGVFLQHHVVKGTFLLLLVEQCILFLCAFRLTRRPEVKEGLDETLEKALSLALGHQQLFRAPQLLWHEYD